MPRYTDRYSDRYTDRARESVGLATCSQRVESREQRVESREQRVESRGALRLLLTRALRALVSDFWCPTLLVVTHRLKSESQVQTARAAVIGTTPASIFETSAPLTPWRELVGERSER